MLNLKEHVNKLYELYNVKGVVDEHGPFDFQTVFGAGTKYIREKIGINFQDEKFLVVLYEETLNSILDFLKSKTATSNAFSLQLGIISIGFINETLANDEKIGNITINISPISTSSIKDFDMDEDPSRNAKTFRERNNVSAGINDIDKSVMKKLSDMYGIKLGFSEIVIPSFIIAQKMILSALDNVLSLSPTKEMELNVLGFFSVTAVKSGNNITYYYHPDNIMKYSIKNDTAAQIEAK